MKKVYGCIWQPSSGAYGRINSLSSSCSRASATLSNKNESTGNILVVLAIDYYEEEKNGWIKCK